MKALIFTRAGEPQEVLQFADVEKPQIPQNGVLVRVSTRPVQPADLAFIKGQYRLRPTFPQTAGLEGAGVVVQAVGADVRVGSRVAFRFPGSWAEFAVVPSPRLIDVPDDVSDETACQMSLNPVTGWALLHEARTVRGDWILLTAATSTVSNIVGTIAHERGINVIGLVRGDETSARARCTADHVFSIERPSLAADIASICGGRGIKALLDSVGGQLVTRLFETLAPGARIIAYGVQDRGPAAVTNAMLIYSNLIWQGFGIDRWLEQLQKFEGRKMYEELWSMIRNGTLMLPVASTHRLEEFGNALSADAANGRNGKVILLSPAKQT
jgi:NADPH:quinone reductase